MKLALTERFPLLFVMVRLTFEPKLLPLLHFSSVVVLTFVVPAMSGWAFRQSAMYCAVAGSGSSPACGVARRSSRPACASTTLAAKPQRDFFANVNPHLHPTPSHASRSSVP